MWINILILFKRQNKGVKSKTARGGHCWKNYTNSADVGFKTAIMNITTDSANSLLKYTFLRNGFPQEDFIF